MPGVVPEEGLADAHEFLQSEWESLACRGALISHEELFRHFVRKFGPPDDVAASYATATGPSPVPANDGATLHDAAVAGRAEPLRRSTPRLVVVAVLALAAGSVAVCGTLVLINYTTAPANLEFITHQGVTISFPQGESSFADRVVSFRRGAPDQGPSRDPQAAIGIPDCQNDEHEEPETSYVALGHGGELTVEFTDNWLCDGDGPDLAIFEIGPQLEFVHVAVSADGLTWHELGITKERAATLDLASLGMTAGRFRFVRLVDTKDRKSDGSEWPGADIDAIGAIHSAP